MQADHSMPEEFWRGRRVLLTGHTGFKGAWLSLWLRRWGAEVTGYALAPSSTPNLWSIVEGASASIIGDIRDFAQLRAAVNQTNPQVVIHMAAQALVKESYRDPLGTYATNVLGTWHVLLAAERHAVSRVVYVSSAQVFGFAEGADKLLVSGLLAPAVSETLPLPLPRRDPFLQELI